MRERASSRSFLRSVVGAALLDLPHFVWRLRPAGPTSKPWVRIRNRNERLESGLCGGARCLWEWTTDLHVVKVFPFAGRWLLERARRDFPILTRDAPIGNFGQPVVSFVIGHRGVARLPHLLATLRTVAAQEDVAFECIVVEQSEESQLQDRLPSWVRHIVTPGDAGIAYCRARAFNDGAREAKSDIIVFHDNDLLMPSRYAAEILGWTQRGFEVVDLKRFLFYLDENQTASVFAKHGDLVAQTPRLIVQNAVGGSIAVTRTAFDAIGGFDEEFVGWGGEDNDFWDRARTRRVHDFGYVPLVHLWHSAQPEKAGGGNGRYLAIREQSIDDRIARLRARASLYASAATALDRTDRTIR
jgi:hypothetical protein